MPLTPSSAHRTVISSAATDSCPLKAAARAAGLKSIYLLDGGISVIEGNSLEVAAVAHCMQSCCNIKRQKRYQRELAAQTAEPIGPAPRDGCSIRSFFICKQLLERWPDAALAQLVIYRMHADNALYYDNADNALEPATARCRWSFHMVPLFVGSDQGLYVVDSFLHPDAPVPLAHFLTKIARDRQAVKLEIIPSNQLGFQQQQYRWQMQPQQQHWLLLEHLGIRNPPL